jgi:phage FluMu protein Com
MEVIRVKYRVRRGNGRTVYTAICYRCEDVLKEVGSFAQKYCPDCKPVAYREKAKERMRRYRARRNPKRRECS